VGHGRIRNQYEQEAAAKAHAPKLRYLSTNKKVATVSKAGKVTGKGKGTCYVYAYAHNGVAKKVKVSVK